MNIDNAYSKPGILDIHLVIDDIHLMSSITMESKNHLGIRKGEYIYTIFKATATHVVREGRYDAVDV
jgi:molybdopterin-binding protein